MSFRIYDGMQTLTFTGSLIATQSSYRDGSVRWSDTRLYRTTAGFLVYERLGRSSVYHISTCSRAPRTTPIPVHALEQPASPCECVPLTDSDSDSDSDSDLHVVREVTRHFARAYPTPAQLVLGLQQQGRLSLLHQELLYEAELHNDDEVLRVLGVKYIP
jgi:hypothetical protein